MARPGRGGKTASFTHEQLQALGCVSKDMPQVQTAPPPTFPTLLTKPIKFDLSEADVEDIEWMKNFTKRIHSSPHMIKLEMAAKSYPSLYSYYLQKLNKKTKDVFVWEMLPSELNINRRKRRIKAGGDAKAPKKPKNIEDRLKALEEKERTDDKHTNAASDSENEEEEIPPDEEMDDENDYGHNYFDNGESYNDDDDHFDDGPVY